MVDVDVVVAGGGSDGATQAGALSVLRRNINIIRIGGASAGAINAAGDALGIDDLPALWRHFLVEGDLEDWHYPVPIRPLGVLGRRRGMMAGNAIRRALTKAVGSARMGDMAKPCRIAVGNLALREIEIIDSEVEDHKDITVVDALCCTSAVPFVIDAQQLRPTQRTLYTDGGTGANVPAGMWDDEPSRPTLVLRFVDDHQARPVITLKDFASAVFDIRQDAANRAMPTCKSVVHYVDLPASHKSLNFHLSLDEVNRRIGVGVDSTNAWILRRVFRGAL